MNSYRAVWRYSDDENKVNVTKFTMADNPIN